MNTSEPIVNSEVTQILMPWGEVRNGDSLMVTKGLPARGIDLIYADPPFFTERHFAGVARVIDEPGEAEGRKYAFKDQWAGERANYLGWLEARIRAFRELLTPTGSFLLHLDWHASHYAKVLCDQIFGEECFQNELIWYYQTGGASKGRFSRKHDTILLYSRGGGVGGADDFYFDGKAIAIPRTEKAMKRARSGIGARIAATDTHKNPDDVLTVPALNPMATERTGYPTQKPVELLERLILALCPPGGGVADFCCGSGTTLVAAQRLGRKWFGCDISPEAVELATKRTVAGRSPA